MNQNRLENRSRDIDRKLINLELLVLDFDGVLTDNRVIVSQDGMEYVACYRGDGFGLSKVKELGIPIWVISTETNPVVEVRCKKLGLESIRGCRQKGEALRSLANRLSCNLTRTMYIGNDINDLDCLNLVGMPVIVSDAHPDVHDAAWLVTNIPGGRGAVREVCDLIISAFSNHRGN